MDEGTEYAPGPGTYNFLHWLHLLSILGLYQLALVSDLLLYYLKLRVYYKNWVLGCSYCISASTMDPRDPYLDDKFYMPGCFEGISMFIINEGRNFICMGIVIMCIIFH